MRPAAGIAAVTSDILTRRTAFPYKRIVDLEYRPKSYRNQASDRVRNKGVNAIAAVCVTWHGIIIKWRSCVEDVFNVEEDLVTTQKSVLEIVGRVHIESDVGVHMVAAHH